MNEVSLEAMLTAREKRAQTIQALKQQFPNQTIISFKLNIPGPIKSTPDYQWAFKQGLIELDQIATCYECQLNNHTGPEAYYMSHLGPDSVKESMVMIEDTHPLGRLFDLDVDGKSRKDLGLQPRKCLICDDDAHACSRSRKHTLETVVETINLRIKHAMKNQ
ncbi:citrate lyase holo-[acyl-carrier protein] synthase [Erysipelothrix piscisicarius]|uniref:citrate lyase holo-[acyl-carrier protein] synthase n=1 Tax=Erysipelothrix piscisicarius TaxID=2485784 RepID=UPI002F924C44